MKSDIDYFHIMNDNRVLFEENEWSRGKYNLLAFKDEDTPPQFYKLRRMKSHRPEYVTSPLNSLDEVDDQSRVLRSNKDTVMSAFVGAFMGHVVQHKHTTHGPQVSPGILISHGPSSSWTHKVDIVFALPCSSQPEESQFLFQRPRLGHWPKHKTLEFAKQCSVFFVPQGPPYNESRHLQWRLSTTLIERQLVFDFTEVQMQVYTLLKMLRVCYIKPQFDDNLSTYHLKTATMFTIESHPPDIWQRNNMVACAAYCFSTLLRWIKLRYCPHFTTHGVNLFYGKLSKNQLKLLEDVIFQIKSDIMWYICNLEMDMFGWRIMDKLGFRTIPFTLEVSKKKSYEMKTQKRLLSCISQLVMWRRNVSTKLCDFFDRSSVLATIKSQLHYLRFKQITGSELEREAATLLIPHLFGTLATVKASHCIATGRPVPQDVRTHYLFSFDSDLVLCKLKYASMLSCTGQFTQAAEMLTHCEVLMGSDVAHHRWSLNGPACNQSIKYVENGLHKNARTMIQKYSTLSVNFSNHELQCMPEHLRYEKCRSLTLTDKVNPLDVLLFERFERFDIDCRLFLYYLQFLVYQRLGQSARQRAALQNMIVFSRCVMLEHDQDSQAIACNVLGHCWELMNRHDLAWKRYQRSLRLRSSGNAAWFHLARLRNTN